VQETARVVVTMPAEPSFLRLARLAAADTGTRAGFTVDEVEDLRLAIDELCGPLMNGAGEVVLAFTSAAGRVDIEGTGAAPDAEPPFADIADAIIAAVVDEHSVDDDTGTRTFRAVKRSSLDGARDS
jgi:serine/threonine-protein kinase RsbW